MKTLRYNLYKTLIIPLVCLVSFQIASAEEVKEVIEKSFDVRSGQNLSVEVYDSHVDVTTHSKSTVEVVLTKIVKAPSEEKANELLEDYRVDFEATGDGIKIETQKPKMRLWDFGRAYHFYAKFEIKVPGTFNTQIATSDGDINVSGPTGSHKIATSDGEVRLEAISGDIQLATSDGDVYLKRINGDVRASTSDGEVLVSEFKGDLSTSTSDGDVTLKAIQGSAEAHTSDGSLHIEFASQPTDACAFRTTDGDITLKVPADIRARFDVSVSSGDLDFEFPVSSYHSSGDSHHFVQEINGGGPLISISTTEGEVEVSKI
jgi:DUF4097 and DUF4098 domain-containing protein YvlB